VGIWKSVVTKVEKVPRITGIEGDQTDPIILSHRRGEDPAGIVVHKGVLTLLSVVDDSGASRKEERD